MQINTSAHERHLLSDKKHNFAETFPEHLAKQANNAMKDVYMLDTLGLTQPVLEADIENSMVARIKTVMLELGYGFSFMGNQYRINANGREYFIDLLFYNRKLQSLIAIEILCGVPHKRSYVAKPVVLLSHIFPCFKRSNRYRYNIKRLMRK